MHFNRFLRSEVGIFGDAVTFRWPTIACGHFQFKWHENLLAPQYINQYNPIYNIESMSGVIYFLLFSLVDSHSVFEVIHWKVERMYLFWVAPFYAELDRC